MGTDLNVQAATAANLLNHSTQQEASDQECTLEIDLPEIFGVKDLVYSILTNAADLVEMRLCPETQVLSLRPKLQIEEVRTKIVLIRASTRDGDSEIIHIRLQIANALAASVA